MKTAGPYTPFIGQTPRMCRAPTGEHTSLARVGIRPVDVIVVLLVVALLVATYVIH